MSTVNAALLAAALLFVLFMVGSALLPALARRGPRRAAHSRLSAAIARATDATDVRERAAAFREASTIALEELHAPRLAARYARWAEEATPGDPATIPVLAAAMTRARRLRALEKLLWRALDAHPSAHDAARDALASLYEGPLHHPERARVVRRLRAEATPPDGAR